MKIFMLDNYDSFTYNLVPVEQLKDERPSPPVPTTSI